MPEHAPLLIILCLAFSMTAIVLIAFSFAWKRGQFTKLKDGSRVIFEGKDDVNL